MGENIGESSTVKGVGLQKATPLGVSSLMETHASEPLSSRVKSLRRFLTLEKKQLLDELDHPPVFRMNDVGEFPIDPLRIRVKDIDEELAILDGQPVSALIKERTIQLETINELRVNILSSNPKLLTGLDDSLIEKDRKLRGEYYGREIVRLKQKIETLQELSKKK